VNTLALSKLETKGDEQQQAELTLMAQADAVAAELVIAGPLLRVSESSDPTTARLLHAVERLTGKTLEDFDPGSTLTGIEWTYRVGVMTGLRLARALDSGAR
jgi:hypothetical protein